MVLDCSSLCLLAIAVGLRASIDTKKCAYCMDVRALSTECDAEPLRCAYGANADPNSLIYCLTVVETPRYITTVRRVVRCISHAAFNLTLGEFREAAQLRECQFDALRDCDCPNCRHASERDYGEPTTTVTTTTAVGSLMLKSLKVQRITNTSSIQPKIIHQQIHLNVSSLGNSTPYSRSRSSSRHLSRSRARCSPKLKYFNLFINALILAFSLSLFSG